MPDFLLEILSEEIPARMQAKAQQDLARLFSDQLLTVGLAAEAIETYATPRRLVLIARGLPAETAVVREETKGPRASAPPQALEGFLRKTGLTQDRLEERDGVYFAVLDRPGRATSAVLAEAVPAIVRAFPWPKSMRWGAASVSTESPRWVRPLQGIVALLGEEIVDFEIAGAKSGAATLGHRFHHPGQITIGGAHDYVEKLQACHVVVDHDERRRIIAGGATAAAAAAGLALVEDEGLIAENAGLTEWPVPLLGRFDPAFLEVPREVIQLTMRTNQKYFAVTDGQGGLAPNFVCTANIDAADGGASIVAGNERVLSARLSDAKFFWEQDLKVPLEEQAKKLGDIVFHEKLGTVALKVERVAKLAQWLVKERIVVAKPVAPAKAGAPGGEKLGVDAGQRSEAAAANPAGAPAFAGATSFAAQVAAAARLAKADLVTQMVGEFPELQGLIGGHLARAQGEDPAVADAIRDHYKPVGQGDEVPTAPVTVAVSLADKLDTIISFFLFVELPTGSRDPYALRRAALGVLSLLIDNNLRLPFRLLTARWLSLSGFEFTHIHLETGTESTVEFRDSGISVEAMMEKLRMAPDLFDHLLVQETVLFNFFLDRLIVQQRGSGVRHDLIESAISARNENDFVGLLARVKALQAFVETPEGADLLAGYKRAANILKKEGWTGTVVPAKAGTPGGEGLGADGALAASNSEANSAGTTEHTQNKTLPYTPEIEETALIAALDSAEPRARAAVEAEDFEGAMAALASLRAPVDSFFDKVTVNDPDPAKREARLALLARMRDAVHRVADFSRIEG
jgi:glycyl-tRNA synthetase beta chain